MNLDQLHGFPIFKSSKTHQDFLFGIAWTHRTWIHIWMISLGLGMLKDILVVLFCRFGYLGVDDNQKSSSLNVIRFMWKVKRPCHTMTSCCCEISNFKAMMDQEVIPKVVRNSRVVSVAHLISPQRLALAKAPWNELLQVNQLSEIVFVQSVLSWAWLYWLILVVSIVVIVAPHRLRHQLWPWSCRWSCVVSKTEMKGVLLVAAIYIYIHILTTAWDGVSIFPSTKDYFQEIVFECFRNQTLWDDSWEMLKNIINMSCNTSITASPCHVKCLLVYLEYQFFQLPHCSYSPHSFVLFATPPIR